MSTNVPSTDIVDFKRDVEDTTRFVNQTSGTVTNRVGKTMRPLPVISDDIEGKTTEINTLQQELIDGINDTAKNLYPVIVFRFGVDSYSIAARNQLGDTAAGDAYRYIGVALPYTVTLATNPVGNPDFEQVVLTDHNNLTNLNAVGAHDDIYTRKFKTVADLRSQTDASGQSIDLDSLNGLEIEWLGYYSEHDGGGNKGIVKTGDSTSLTDDGGSIFVIVNDSVDGVWIEAKLKGRSVNARKFGVKSDGSPTADQLEAVLAHDTDSIKLPSGVIYVERDLILDGITHKSVYSRSKSAEVLLGEGCDFNIKSPRSVEFSNLRFTGTPHDTVYQSIRVSNYDDFKFENCEFSGFGGLTKNKAGSTIVYMYAGDFDGADFAAGDSKKGRIINCDFDGGGRFTNFGVRYYSEWDIIPTATNTDGLVQGCTFKGFNWNPLEIAGPKTSFITVNNCTGYANGLSLVDIDKGANNCLVTNLVINRLLGNIDTDINPNTRIAGVLIQGWQPDKPENYAHNNIVDNIVIKLLKSDLDAYLNGAAVVALSSARDNTVTNIRAECDGVPTKPATDRFGLALVVHDTCSGNTVDGIECINASSGIFQTTINNASMTYNKPNTFINITNVGTMKGELVWQAQDAQSGALSQCLYVNLMMKTDLTETFNTTYTNKYAVAFKASGSSANYGIIKNSHLGVPNETGKYFALHQIAKLSINDVSINDQSTTSRFISAEGSTNPQFLGISKVGGNFGRNPLDVTSIFNELPTTCKITAGMNTEGLEINHESVLFASAQPTAPVAGNWGRVKVERLTKVAGSSEGWLNAGGVWKEYGTVSA